MVHRFEHRGHTLCVGFTVAPVGRSAFDFTALTYHGAGVKDKIDYISFFPMLGTMRANLFSFHDIQEEWPHKLHSAPRETLLATIPQLAKVIGDFEIVDKVKLRAIDLRFAENYRKPGIVLIGDTFQTSCPAAGTGLTRALTDVDRLCNVHIPHWLESPGMSVEKICKFYDDPVKKQVDAHCIKLANYRRAITVDTSVPWELRRRFAYPIRQAGTIMRLTADHTTKLRTAFRNGISSKTRD